MSCSPKVHAVTPHAARSAGNSAFRGGVGENEFCLFGRPAGFRSTASPEASAAAAAPRGGRRKTPRWPVFPSKLVRVRLRNRYRRGGRRPLINAEIASDCFYEQSVDSTKAAATGNIKQRVSAARQRTVGGLCFIFPAPIVGMFLTQ